MKTKILKSMVSKGIYFAAVFVAGAMLSSCSQKLTSIRKSGNLQYSQEFKTKKSDLIPQTTALVSKNKTINQSAATNTGQLMPVSTKIKSISKANLNKELNHIKHVAIAMGDKTSILFTRQWAAMNQLTKNNSLASHESITRERHHNYLRKAFILLIIGLLFTLLSILIHGLVGAILSYIGYVFFILAIVFFIFWLIWEL